MYLDLLHVAFRLPQSSLLFLVDGVLRASHSLCQLKCINFCSSSFLNRPFLFLQRASHNCCLTNVLKMGWKRTPLNDSSSGFELPVGIFSPCTLEYNLSNIRVTILYSNRFLFSASFFHCLTSMNSQFKLLSNYCFSRGICMNAGNLAHDASVSSKSCLLFYGVIPPPYVEAVMITELKEIQSWEGKAGW